MLDLPAVLDLLAEHAVLVAQAVADRRDLERGQRVEKAGGQPAQPAVAQPRVGLLLEQGVPVLPDVRGEVALRTKSSICRLVMALAIVRPIRNSIDR